MSSIPAQGKAETVYLGWEKDPCHSITIHHHCKGTGGNQSIEFRKKGSTGSWSRVTGEFKVMPDDESGFSVYHTLIENLTPNTRYEFRHVSNRNKVFTFKTMPVNLTTPIKFAVAADSHAHELSSWFDELTENMGKFNPDFVLGVGDFTYDDGDIGKDETDNWVSLLKRFEKRLKKDNGDSVPIIPAIGNHDSTRQRFGTSGRETARNFMRLFSFPTQENYPQQMPGYGYLDFGDWLRLIVLDTNHIQPYHLEQRSWLQNVIINDKTHTIPMMHVLSYAMRTGNPFIVSDMHRYWYPFFYKQGVKAIFGGHMHGYSRSKPIKKGQVNSVDGITHFGAGTWAILRNGGIPSEPEWIDDQKYADLDSENAKHFYGVTLYMDKMVVESINYKGFTFHTEEINL